MTVSDLIDELSQYPEDMEVVNCEQNEITLCVASYVYGKILYNDENRKTLMIY